MTDLSDATTWEHLRGLVWVGKRLLVLEGIGYSEMVLGRFPSSLPSSVHTALLCCDGFRAHRISSIPSHSAEIHALSVTERAGGSQHICISSCCSHFAFSSFVFSWLHGFSFSLFLSLVGSSRRG